MLPPAFLSDRAFISSWKTNNAGTSTSTQITIPTSSTGSYSCVVDWGDGTTNFFTTYNDAAWTHTYGVAGTYTVKIYGKFVGLVFNNSGDKLKLLNISRWGTDFRVGTTQSAYFYGCANLTITATDILSTVGLVNVNNMFRDCVSITTIPSINSWNFSSVGQAGSMFNGATSFNQPLALNLSSCLTFASFLQGCTNFNSSIAGLNTSSATSMNAMFRSCTNFNQQVSSLNTSNVTNMYLMFESCTNFNQSVSSFNTSKVTEFSLMFRSCLAFNQPVTFDTSKGTNLSSMFRFDTLFNQDISSFNISAMTNADLMFSASGFSQTNYDLLLVAWANQPTVQNNVVFSAGSAKYGAGAPATARAFLTGTKLWTITDGGPA